LEAEVKFHGYGNIKAYARGVSIEADIVIRDSDDKSMLEICIPRFPKIGFELQVEKVPQVFINKVR